MSVDHGALLKDLQRQVRLLEEDLRKRANDVPEIAERLKAEYAGARTAERTAETFGAWQESATTQAAVAWVLGCVFVRFLEDNELVDEPLLAGTDERGDLAAERRTRYFRASPNDTDRDYILDCFRHVASLPGMASLYDERHNPVWQFGISGDAAKMLIQFWRGIVPETGELVHDFRDPVWDTRFLGDLYQDLSESIRKRYALLQTPDFIEEFILDRTLLPALDEFGLAETRMIDPTCGSGHFLLGGFRILLDRWQKREPNTGERELVQRALDGVYGVDINPYATAIARFRLVIEAVRESHIDKLRNAPAYRINLATGDSLLHGPRMLTAADSLAAYSTARGELALDDEADQLAQLPGIGHAFASEDLDELNRILGQQYQAVVGNPPYITVRDSSLNSLYRQRYLTCHREYSIAVPFTERFFQLAIPYRGQVGLITAKSFMKREFGKLLVERFLPRVRLNLVVDASGVYIPGHGTPTVIMFGVDAPPVSENLTTILGIRGEPEIPDQPRRGQVWSAIVEALSYRDPENRWVQLCELPRSLFARHPISLAGGGVMELAHLIDHHAIDQLGSLVKSLGYFGQTNADQALIAPAQSLVRREVEANFQYPIVLGDDVRDWSVRSSASVIFPYDDTSLRPLTFGSGVFRWLWLARTVMGSRRTFGKKTYFDEGRSWWGWHQVALHRLTPPNSISYAFVATHNHFVFDRGGKVFNRSAPIIKLPADATEADHLSLLGLLNSSTACFWMKQVFHNKGSTVDSKGARQTTVAFENFYEFTGTGLKKFPISKQQPTWLATHMDRLAIERQSHLPAQLASTFPTTRSALDKSCATAAQILTHLIALQEELDWQCYQFYGVTEEVLCMVAVQNEQDNCLSDIPGIHLGQRAFEIAMARRMAAGEFETSWFERHGSEPTTELPTEWPSEYQACVEMRIALIESDRNIQLLEQPEYKRRWNLESWDEQEQRVLTEWLLDRLETDVYWAEPRLQSVRSLAYMAERDDEFRAVAELLEGRPDIEYFPLLERLINGECVPFLPALRYKASGLRKRQEWEETWALQREEDKIDEDVVRSLVRLKDEDDDVFEKRLLAEQRRVRLDKLGPISAPPKYKQADFINATYWRLRGALDVPKERFTSYPHSSPFPHDGELIGWAGWDHLQQAIALASQIDSLERDHGWSADQLKPVFAGLIELMPWLKQWHHERDPAYGNESMDSYMASFLSGELQRHGLTEEDVRVWTPPARARGGRRRSRAV